MIKAPPQSSFSEYKEVFEESFDKLEEYLEIATPIDKKGRYLHYDEFRFRVNSKLDVNLAWALTKHLRNRQLRYIGYNAPISGDSQDIKPWRLLLTPTAHKAMSQADRYSTTAALELMRSKIGKQEHLNYLLQDLIEDEAISSSQLEGAATTTLAAKSMLKGKKKPRTMDEKMIIGNYKMMRFAWEVRGKKLDLDLILAFHKIGVEGIDDDKYFPGNFRDRNDVVVENYEGEVIHQPPNYQHLKPYLSMLCTWANECHDDTETNRYIHPLIKAIILHFSIGYFHPFRDGNGRVARALFYWFMFKSDYAAFQYIAISTLLKKSPSKYVKSYLYTETDEMDLTYFIDFQCKVVNRAMDKLLKTYKEKMQMISEFNQWLWESGLMAKLNDKQKVLFQVASGGENLEFTVKEASLSLGCSYNAASSALKGLVDLKLFKKRKEGRKSIFSMIPQEKLLQNWVSI